MENLLWMIGLVEDVNDAGVCGGMANDAFKLWRTRYAAGGEATGSLQCRVRLLARSLGLCLPYVLDVKAQKTATGHPEGARVAAYLHRNRACGDNIIDLTPRCKLPHFTLCAVFFGPISSRHEEISATRDRQRSTEYTHQASQVG